MRLVEIETPKSDLGYMYRYEDWNYGDDYKCRRFPILKETRCGYWIQLSIWGGDNRKRWVAKYGKNNYAKITKEDALYNYYRRKSRQAAILASKLRLIRDLRDRAKAEIDGKEVKIDIFGNIVTQPNPDKVTT